MSFIESLPRPGGFPPRRIEVLYEETLWDGKDGRPALKLQYIKGSYPHFGQLHNGWQKETVAVREKKVNEYGEEIWGFRPELKGKTDKTDVSLILEKMKQGEPPSKY